MCLGRESGGSDDEHTPVGIFSSASGSAMLIGDLLARRAELSRDRIALVDTGTGRRLTYAQVDDRATRCAAFLRDELRVGSGDRVAFLAHNTTDLVEMLFACSRLGALLVPLNWRLAVEELSDIVDDCTPTVLVHGPEFAGEAAALRPRLADGGLVTLGDEPADGAWAYEPGLTAASGEPLRGAPRDERDPWYLLYTSGTTGRPKGVIQTAGMVLVNHLNMGTAIELTAADTSLNMLPQFHTGGINLFTLPTLLAGGTAIVQRTFVPGETLQLLADGTTCFFAVPAVYQALAQQEGFASADLSGVRVWACGGAPMPLSVLQAYTDRGIAIRQGCGMTETGPTVFLLDAEHAVDKAGSVGKPQLLVEARAVDEAGRDVAVDVAGELLVRGPGITPGYWQRPDATAEAFTDDGWLRTGDVGRRDRDGFWYIVDRVKDMFISGGENVYPAEVEQVLDAHPAVAEVAVVGVPDERWGEVGAAAVVAAGPEALRPDDLRAWCRERLASYKVPRHVVVLDALPRNATGKVRKPELRAHLLTEVGQLGSGTTTPSGGTR